MLKPVTKQEKLEYTLKMQAEIGREELLEEAYFSGYEGYLDIWLVSIKTEKKEIKLQLQSKRVPAYHSTMSHPDAVRYSILQKKGYKPVK